MFTTDNPIADYDRYDRERTKWLERKPKCEECGHHIQQETAVRIGDKWYCDECLDNLREDTDLEEDYED